MESSFTEFERKALKGSSSHECPKHGPVVAFYPIHYEDKDRGIDVKSGPFCIMCIIERQQAEYAEFTVTPLVSDK